MADFKKATSAPEARMAEARAPHDQGGVPKTGFADAPLNDAECCNFETGPGVPPGRTKIR